jgi:hypothetical protein
MSHRSPPRLSYSVGVINIDRAPATQGWSGTKARQGCLELGKGFAWIPEPDGVPIR